MSDCVLRVDKLANGYTVEVLDPEISAANSKRDNSSKGTYTPYKDPWKEYAFKTVEETNAFIGKVLPKLKPAQEDVGAFFNEAVGEDN